MSPGVSDLGSGDHAPPWRSVLGWTVPTTVATVLNQEYDAGFTGHDPGDVDLVVTLDRTSQLAAPACHQPGRAREPAVANS